MLLTQFHVADLQRQARATSCGAGEYDPERGMSRELFVHVSAIPRERPRLLSLGQGSWPLLPRLSLSPTAHVRVGQWLHVLPEPFRELQKLQRLQLLLR
ncbi:hypothetical protein D3C85_1464130 [compost metagenome]